MSLAACFFESNPGSINIRDQRANKRPSRSIGSDRYCSTSSPSPPIDPPKPYRLLFLFESMSERKRKHKALSGENADVERKVITPKTDSNRSPVVVANTGNIPAQGAGNAKATLPSACMKLHESPCETLPPGLIAKIGTYCKLAPLGTDIDKKTLMSLCLAVGPYVASYIRKAYLENRLYYLSYLKRYLRVRQNYENKPLSDNDCADLGEKLKQWMLHNPWWKEACLYPTTFNQKQGGEYPPICKVIRLQESTDAGGVRAWLNASIYSTTSLQVAIDPQLCRFLFDKAWDERYHRHFCERRPRLGFIS